MENLSDMTIEKFQKLFTGFTKAYGTFEINKSNNDKKKKGRALTVRKKINFEHYKKHLYGEQGIGVVPIKDDNHNIVFCALDIDDYNLPHEDLLKRINESKIPFLTCLSKSGGYHLYLFFAEDTSAQLIQKPLRKIAKYLGYPNCEIFPKQEKRLKPRNGETEQIGNWINLPYFSGNNSTRTCVQLEKHLELEDFLHHAEKSKVSLSQLIKLSNEIQLDENLDENTSFNKLLKSEGRNSYLFKYGCSLRKRGIEDIEISKKIKIKNIEANANDHPNFAQGPLENRELSIIIKQVLKYQPGDLDDDTLEEMNKKHAVVMLQGKTFVLNKDFDPSINKKLVTFSTFTDFKNRYCNKYSFLEGSNKSLAQCWLSSSKRKTYDGLIFDPEKNHKNFYNLYQGLAVVPKKGKWNKFREHINNVVAASDEELGSYIIHWMADAIQNPTDRPGVALVLKGKQGTGKGIFARGFGYLFGNHFLHLFHGSHLTGHFNSHLKDKLMIFADEAVWGGDKKAEGMLKGLITEPSIPIEMKGKDVFTVSNFSRIIISSNNDWVVPAGAEERRFCVIEPGDSMMQNSNYFKSINEELNNGGYEAMLYDLQNIDLEGIDLRRFPKTNALSIQKSISSSDVEKFWEDRLYDGSTISDQDVWKNSILCYDLYQDYILFSKKIGNSRPKTMSSFGKNLKNVIPEIDRQRGTTKKRNYIYILPDLEQCRLAFDKARNTKTNWEGV